MTEESESSGLYWKVTHVHDDEDARDVGRYGPGVPEADTSLPLLWQWGSYDDDGNLMALGGAANVDSCEYAHEFCAANWGCTRTEIREGLSGPWQEFIS